MAPDRHQLRPATRLAVDGICALINKREAILEEQEDTLSELEQELDEFLVKEELDALVEVGIHPTLCNLQTGDQGATLAGGLDNVALGSLSVVNCGQGNQVLGTSSVVVEVLYNLSEGTNCVAGGGDLNTASGTSAVIGR